MFSYTVILFGIASMLLLQFSCTSGLNIEVPSECKNEEICYKKPAGYPAEEIENYIKQKQRDSNFTLFTQRDYYDEEEEVAAPNGLNCYLKAEVRKPYLVAVKRTWKPVVQSEYFTQKIREVKCEKEGESCMAMDDYLSRFRKTATCITKTAAILIQFYDPLEKEIKQVNKLVAVCCTCSIKEN